MGAGSADRLRIEVLGPLRLLRGADELQPPQPQPARLLVRLALADAPLTAAELTGQLEITKDALHQRLHRLKMTGVPVEVDKGSGNRGQYRLDPIQVEVDAREFVDGVSDLADAETGISACERLLGLWRGVPDQAVAGDHSWGAVLDARNRMLDFIRSCTVDRRPAGIIDFAAYFPDDKLVQSLVPPHMRKDYRCILVVDDTDADYIRDILSESYGVVALTSIAEWRAFRDSGGLANIHGALVDLWLGTDNGSPRGHWIIDHLRDKTEIPCVAVSVDPLPEIGDPAARYQAGRRLLYVLPKGADNRYLDRDLADMARLMVGSDTQSELKRLKCWLLWAFHEVEDEESMPARTKPSTTLRRAKSLRDEAQAAIDDGDVGTARQRVDEFCRKFVGRPGPPALR